MTEASLSEEARPVRTRMAARVRRRERILTAAAAVFHDIGLRQATMEDVARRLNTSKVALYRYFPTKDALLRAILDEVAAKFIADEHLPWPGLKRALRRSLARARENVPGYLLMCRSSAHDPALGQYWVGLRDVVIEATRGRITLLDLPICRDPMHMETMARGLVHFLFESLATWIEIGDPDRDEEWLAWVTTAAFSITGWRGDGHFAPLPNVLAGAS